MDYEVQGVRARGRPKKTGQRLWKELSESQLNEDAMEEIDYQRNLTTTTMIGGERINVIATSHSKSGSVNILWWHSSSSSSSGLQFCRI